jgi:hypothetical protein
LLLFPPAAFLGAALLGAALFLFGALFFFSQHPALSGHGTGHFPEASALGHGHLFPFFATLFLAPPFLLIFLVAPAFFALLTTLGFAPAFAIV